MSAPRDRLLILAPLLLGAQAVMVHRISIGERPPPPPDLYAFPAEFQQWREIREDPIEADIARELRADRLLNRTYRNASTDSYLNLFVAWFQSQRGGAQPHSPKVCLPGAGWLTESSGRLALETAAGAIAVNRMLISNRNQRAVVLYWYQSPRRVMTTEWEAKLWVISDAVRYKRTDMQLVRVVAWQNGTDAATLSQAAAFATATYPLLLRASQ